MTLVQESFSLDPFADALFVFCNRNRNRLKILEWDGDGFWLYFKRLERGRFRCPSEGDTATMVLDANELSCLIDGARLDKKLKRKEVRIPAHPDGYSGSIRTVNREHPDTLSMVLILQ